MNIENTEQRELSEAEVALIAGASLIPPTDAYGNPLPQGTMHGGKYIPFTL